MALPKKLKNFNVFLEGEGYAGRATEMTLPKLSKNFEEFRAGGMNGPIGVDMGQELMECDITLAEFSRPMLEKYGVCTVDGVQMRFRGAAVNDGVDCTTDAIEIVMRGRFKEIDLGTAKSGEATDMKLSANLSYFRYSLNGDDIIEIDLINMVEKVGGKDRLEQQRNALGF